jgi:hypothetical protein
MGRTLEQMDAVFGDVSSEAEEARKVRIERQIIAEQRNDAMLKA